MNWGALLALLALCFAARPVVTSESDHLRHLLFYTCATREVANQCEESFSMDQRGVANLGFTANLTTVAQGARLAPPIRSLYAIHDIFFVNGKGLNPTWEADWERARAAIQPFVEGGAIVGIFVGDELLSDDKITYAELMTTLTAVSELTRAYPQLFVWMNEGGTRWTDIFKKEGGIPALIDVISLDDYYLSVAEHRSFYETAVYPLMTSPNQSAFIVPAAYGTTGNASWTRASPWCCGGTSLADCDACMVNRTAAYYDWARNDARISGLAPWHWDTRGKDEVSTYKEIGVADMPRLQAAWRAIHDELSPSITS